MTQFFCNVSSLINDVMKPQVSSWVKNVEANSQMVLAGVSLSGERCSAYSYLLVDLTRLWHVTRLDEACDVCPDDGPTQSEHARRADLANLLACVGFVHHACPTVWILPLLFGLLPTHGLSWFLVKSDICFNSKRIEVRKGSDCFNVRLIHPSVRGSSVTCHCDV